MTTKKASILAVVFFIAYIVMLIIGSWRFFIRGGDFWVWKLWPTWIKISIWIPIAGLIVSKLMLVYLLWKDEKLKSILVAFFGAALLYCMISFPWFFLILLFLGVIIPLLAMLGVVSKETRYNLIIIIIGPFEDY